MAELVEIAQELYALAPREFTAARNDRVKQLRGSDPGLAASVGALAKPATAAWVLNMLVRHEDALVGQVLELGSSLRQAQESLAGDELRELNRQRRRLTAAVTSQARDLARRLGVRVTDAVADQVEESLRAAMTDATAAGALRTGLLVKPLSATGLDELDVSSVVAVPEAVGGAAPASGSSSGSPASPSLTVVGGRKTGARGKAAAREEAAARRRAVKEAEAEAKRAEKDAAKARKELDRAVARVDELEARSLQLQSELEEVRRRAAELEHALESVDDELSDAEDDRDSARHESTRADHVHAEAVAALERARST